MNSKFKAIASATGARLKHFFLGGEELEFEYSCSSEALKEKLRSTSQGILSFSESAQVRVWGDLIHVGWSPGFMRRNSTPVFHGIIEPTPSGSRIRGRISAGRFEQLFMGIWFGGIAIFSLIFVWTVFIPAGGMMLIWIGSHLVGDVEDETKITSHLSSLCADVTQAQPPECPT